jgi:Tol biopolymer transport system component
MKLALRIIRKSLFRFSTVLLLAHGALAQAKPASLTTLGALLGVRVGDVLASPNGKLIAYTTMGELRVFDIAKQTSKTIATGPVADLLSWAPTGDAIAFVRERDADFSGYLWSIPLDPATGEAKGPAQRVSVTKIDDSGKFAPDGKSIAFVSAPADRRLIVVPSTGGKERTVAQLPRHADVSGWSSDGSKIYLIAQASGLPGPFTWSFDEVSTKDGARRQLAPQNTCGFGPGFGKYRIDYGCSGVAVDTVNRVLDSNGHVVGSFSIPSELRPRDLMSNALLLERLTAPVSLDVLTLADGRSQQISQLTLDATVLSWSPDGRRVAIRTWERSRDIVAIMNADGTGRQDIPVGDILEKANGSKELKWSPDGRFVAFLASMASGINVIEVANGQIRRVVTPLPPFRSGLFEWRRDSRAIRYLQRSPVPGSPFSFHEAPLDGTDRQLGDVTSLITGALRFRFVTDSTMVIIRKDTTFVVSTAGDVIRRYPAEGNRWFPASSRDGDLIAAASVAPGGSYSYSTIELLSVRAGTRRELPMPFEVSTAPGSVLMFLPDGEHLLAVSAATPSLGRRLWLVSLNGEQPRPIATLSDNVLPTYMELSPDGKRLLYTRPGSPTTTFIKADFSSILER